MIRRAIGFDADDTLWVNEPYFQDVEHRFCSLLEEFLEPHEISRELLKTESNNIPLYGYGVKAFTLSMIETAVKISNGALSPSIVSQILEFGKEMLRKDVELLDGVKETLSILHEKFQLVVATKGDLRDQERKLQKSGLIKYFHHVEIMSEKEVPDYQKLLWHLDVAPSEFIMIGNSLKSDILPALEIGAKAIHIPYHTTWALEKVEIKIDNPNFYHAENILDACNIILNIFERK